MGYHNHLGSSYQPPDIVGACTLLLGYGNQLYSSATRVAFNVQSKFSKHMVYKPVSNFYFPKKGNLILHPNSQNKPDACLFKLYIPRYIEPKVLSAIESAVDYEQSVYYSDLSWIYTEISELHAEFWELNP